MVNCLWNKNEDLNYFFKDSKNKKKGNDEKSLQLVLAMLILSGWGIQWTDWKWRRKARNKARSPGSSMQQVMNQRLKATMVSPGMVPIKNI